MSRALAASIAGIFAILLAVGFHPGVARAAEAETAPTELDDGLVRWLLRVRWWRQTPEQPALPTLSEVSYDRVTVSWAAPDSALFEIVDYDVQYRAADTDGFVAWTHEGAATEATITGLAEVTEYEVRMRAENEVGVSDWSASASATTLIAPPKFLEGESAERAVEENTAAGEAIGEPVAAMVREGDLRYSLAGEDAEAFAIDASSGQLRTRQGVEYDHEARSSYAVEVAASNSRGGTGRIAVQVRVLDVDEPPGKPDAPSVSAQGSTGLQVTWNAPTNTGPKITGYDVEYRPQGDEDYKDVGHQGTRMQATITGLGRGTVFEVRVRAVNDEGTGAWSDAAEGRTPGSGGGDPEGPHAPASQRAFDALFVGNFLSTESGFIQFLPRGRFRELDQFPGDYTYERTGPNTGTVTQTYDDTNQYGGRCTIRLTFDSTSAGTLRYTCDGGQTDREDWRRDPMDVRVFNIEVIWRGFRSNAVDSAFQAAVARWERVIAADIIAVHIPVFGDLDFGVIDDLRVYVQVETIDGVGGTLAQAGPRVVRTASTLPVVSIIRLDEDDISRVSSAVLRDIALHEMAHALGFGVIWGDLGLLSNPAANADPDLPLPDTLFSGANAIAAFDDAGGTRYTGGKVPVENSGGEGTADSHWRRSVFGGELMIGSFRASGTTQLPMGAITVQSMADLGYRIDVGAADGYALPLADVPADPTIVGTDTLEGVLPLKCIVTRPVPTDGITVIELKSDGRR